jgi:hypothetical protein
MSGSYNIVARKGSTFRFAFTVATDGTPWNLDSYTARMQVRRSVNDTNKILDLTSPTDITINSLGSVVVAVSATTMTAITAGRYLYDLEVESAGGEVTALLEGRFVVKPEVTQ